MLLKGYAEESPEDERWFIVYLSDSSNGDVRHQDSSSDKVGDHRAIIAVTDAFSNPLEISPNITLGF